MPQILGKEVGPTGFGLMGMTWRASPPPAEQSYKTMKSALTQGSNFWNGGEIYGTPERNSLHLLNEYFTQNPQDVDKVIISIKGGLLSDGSMKPDSSRANVRRSINECLRVLDGKKFLDIFECARMDGKTPVEETIAAMAEFVKEGKLGGISMSEVGPETIRRAAKVHPIACVEVEFSMYSTDILENGIAQACGELGIPIIAYSPLCRGFLSGQFRKFEDLPPNDLRRTMPRFQPDVFHENIRLADEVEELAKQKGCTTAQVALAWVRAHGKRNGLPEIIPIPGATTEERVVENMKEVSLTDEDMAVIGDILKRVAVKGGRYSAAGSAYLNA